MKILQSFAGHFSCRLMAILTLAEAPVAARAQAMPTPMQPSLLDNLPNSQDLKNQVLKCSGAQALWGVSFASMATQQGKTAESAKLVNMVNSLIAGTTWQIVGEPGKQTLRSSSSIRTDPFSQGVMVANASALRLIQKDPALWQEQAPATLQQRANLMRNASKTDEFLTSCNEVDEKYNYAVGHVMATPKTAAPARPGAR